jgi:hypothetical protein
VTGTKWAPKRDEYYVQTGSMFENPHGVPHDEIVRFVLENPPEVSAQVVFGKYVESSGLVFTGELVQMMFDRSLPRVLGNTFIDREAAEQGRIWASARDGWWGTRFHTGVDFARQTDFTVITTIDTFTLPARVVYFKRLNRVPWDSIYAEVGRARSLFGPNILCDATGPGGDVVMDALESSRYCPEHHRVVKVGSGCVDAAGKPMTHGDGHLYLSLACCEGYGFTSSTKKELVDHLRLVLSAGYDSRTPDVAFGNLRCPPIVQLEEELSFYAWDDKRLVTDCLFSLALACWSGLEQVVFDPVFGSPFGG